MKYRKYFLLAAAFLALLACALMFIPGFQFSVALCFAFGALFILFWFLTRSPTALTRAICRVLCILWAMGLLVAGITASFIINAAHPSSQPACDYILVLGAGVRGTEPSLSLQERINAAYDYLTANPDTVAILSGGQGSGENITEAACMYQELTKMGIDGSRLLLEENSTSTIENLRFSMDILEAAAGIRPTEIGIVSSEYHLFRAGLFAKEFGLEAHGIPAKTTWFPLRLNYYLREIAAVWKYLVLGP